MDHPVTVSMTFSSLETAITALATLRASGSPVKTDTNVSTDKAPAPPKPETASTDKASDAKAAGSSTKKAAATPPATPAPVPPVASPASPPATSAPDAAEVALLFKPVGEAISAAATAHRAEVLALLTKYGVKKGSELKLEQFDQFMAELSVITNPPGTDDLVG